MPWPLDEALAEGAPHSRGRSILMLSVLVLTLLIWPFTWSFWKLKGML